MSITVVIVQSNCNYNSNCANRFRITNLIVQKNYSSSYSFTDQILRAINLFYFILNSVYM